jgi:ribonuclease-3
VKLSADLRAFAARLGHAFAQPELLIRALTHASIAGPQRPDNQRLEFLGDRVLGLVIAEAVCRADEAAREGDLAPRFNALVRRETCAEIARRLDLGSVLKLGRSEMLTGGRRKEALLADAMEAVIAAVYLDAGYGAAERVVLAHWGAEIAGVETDARDPKTALQEHVQAQGQPPPDYVQVGREGPDHAPVFTIEARVAGGARASGRATSKRQAEQDAARTLLRKLEGEDD